MVRRLWWLTAVMALVISAGARAQYQGYLPVQTGGSDQVTVSVASNTWGIYTFRQQDLDTVLVGYPPNMREMQVIDTTCGVVYDLEASQPFVTQPATPQPSPIRFTEVVERFARQQKMNVLAEYLTHEQAGAMSGVSLLPETPTAEDIARIYAREIVRVGNTLILRPLRTYDYFRFNEERHLNIFGALMWRNKQLQVQAKKNGGGTMRVTIRALEVPLKELCEQFQKETGWKIEVEPELQNTRVFAYWQSASPGEVVEAISVLLQTGVEVKLSLSEAQKEERKQAREQLLKNNPRAERWRRSDELLQQLLPLLTPEEIGRFKRGERVDIPLSRLPEDMHDRALQYVEYALHVLETMRPEPQLSQLRDRLRQLEVTLHLPSAMLEHHIFSGGIGISVRDPETGFEANW